MIILGQGIPSPHGVRLIISIHEGFLPFPVSDGLFKDTSDGFEITAIGGDPIQASCVRPYLRDDRMVFAKARVGHCLEIESVTRWIVDATSHSFDRHILEYNNRARYRLPRGSDRDTNFDHDRCGHDIDRGDGKTG